MWSGSNCAMLSHFLLNDCSGLALAAERQAQREELVEGERESTCTRDPVSPECSDLAAKSRSEAFRYNQLQQQYELCRGQGFFPFAGGYYPFGGYYEFGNLFNVYLDELRNQ
jgi:hypothetical protein